MANNLKSVLSLLRSYYILLCKFLPIIITAAKPAEESSPAAAAPAEESAGINLCCFLFPAFTSQFLSYWYSNSTIILSLGCFFQVYDKWLWTVIHCVLLVAALL